MNIEDLTLELEKEKKVNPILAQLKKLFSFCCSNGINKTEVNVSWLKLSLAIVVASITQSFIVNMAGTAVADRMKEKGLEKTME